MSESGHDLDPSPPRRGRRPNPQRRAETRAALLAAALASLGERGYAATTTTEVVRRSGLSRGALFDHFASRDDLMAAVARQAVADLEDLYDSIFDEARTTSDEPAAVVAVGAIHAIVGSPSMRIVQMLLAEATTSATLRDVLQPVAAANFDRLFERAREVLPNLDSDRATYQSLLVVWFAMLGLAAQRAVYVEPSIEEAVLDALTDVARATLHDEP